LEKTRPGQLAVMDELLGVLPILILLAGDVFAMVMHR
jgi:hypothetical protein